MKYRLTMPVEDFDAHWDKDAPFPVFYTIDTIDLPNDMVAVNVTTNDSYSDTTINAALDRLRMNGVEVVRN